MDVDYFGAVMRGDIRMGKLPIGGAGESARLAESVKEVFCAAILIGFL